MEFGWGLSAILVSMDNLLWLTFTALRILASVLERFRPDSNQSVLQTAQRWIFERMSGRFEQVLGRIQFHEAMLQFSPQVPPSGEVSLRTVRKKSPSNQAEEAFLIW